MNSRFVLSFTAIIIILFSSCAEKKSNSLAVLHGLNETLERSGSKLKNESKAIYESMKGRLTDPSRQAKAEIWYLKLVRVRQYTGLTLQKIAEIKTATLRAANYSIDKKGKTSFNEEDKNAIRTVLEQNGTGRSLYKTLMTLKDSLFGIDTLIQAEFKNNLYILPHAFNKVDQADEFVKTFFGDVTALDAITRLNQLQNNVLLEENRISTFLHDQTTYHPSICTFDLPIVRQSSFVVRKGEQLTIEAGVTNFRTQGNLNVKFGSNMVPLNEFGLAVYKFRTAKAPGKYSLPVQIEFMDQDGKTQMMNKTITYRVVE